MATPEIQHQPENAIAQSEAGKFNVDNFDKQVKDSLHLSVLDTDKVLGLRDLVQKFDAATDDPEISRQFEKNLEDKLKQHAANLDRFKEDDTRLILEQARAVEDLQNTILEMTQNLPKSKIEQAKADVQAWYAKAKEAVTGKLGTIKKDAKEAAQDLAGEQGENLLGKGLAKNAADVLRNRGNQ
jgi:hypothetical protein